MLFLHVAIWVKNMYVVVNNLASLFVSETTLCLIFFEGYLTS